EKATPERLEGVSARRPAIADCRALLPRGEGLAASFERLLRAEKARRGCQLDFSPARTRRILATSRSPRGESAGKVAQRHSPCGEAALPKFFRLLRAEKERNSYPQPFSVRRSRHARAFLDPLSARP